MDKQHDAGQQLAIFGADRAAAHADRVHGSWSDIAWQFLVQFGQSRKAVPLPPDGRAWGSIFMRASKAALIRRIGYAPMKDPKCHANPKAVWIWVG